MSTHVLMIHWDNAIGVGEDTAFERLGDTVCEESQHHMINFAMLLNLAKALIFGEAC